MKPKRPQPKTPNKKQSRDSFQTPKYATDLIVPYMPNTVLTVWECAAGKGKISYRLNDHKYFTISTDLITGFNFLETTPDFPFDAIITNPPFSLKKEFYDKCLYYGLPFALLVPIDMNQWNLEAVAKDGAQWLVPNRRIDYITPNGRSGKTSQAQFHSGWLTWGFNLPHNLTVVELPLETKKNPALI